MSDYTLTIKSTEKKGVLDDITDVITSHGANISYVHLFVEQNNMGSINLELEHVENIDELELSCMVLNWTSMESV